MTLDDEVEEEAVEAVKVGKEVVVEVEVEVEVEVVFRRETLRAKGSTGVFDVIVETNEAVFEVVAGVVDEVVFEAVVDCPIMAFAAPFDENLNCPMPSVIMPSD
jgi:hypothetical protein